VNNLNRGGGTLQIAGMSAQKAPEYNDQPAPPFLAAITGNLTADPGKKGSRRVENGRYFQIHFLEINADISSLHDSIIHQIIMTMNILYRKIIRALLNSKFPPLPIPRAIRISTRRARGRLTKSHKK